jgi:hypothetical protein
MNRMRSEQSTTLEEAQLAQSATPKETQLGISSVRQLTPRELQIATLVAKRYTSSEIGARSFGSPKTRSSRSSNVCSASLTSQHGISRHTTQFGFLNVLKACSPQPASSDIRLWATSYRIQSIWLMFYASSPCGKPR